ncbi:MAG: 2-dehydropantoate 2-reductase [Candidatus Binatia bacterium]|nr:MAG: 2-dehydropantoate 2-reductase [Candidatus Binatia bacterium]
MARLLVAGAGALGSVFGALLRLRGHEVALLGRKPHLDAVERQGLFVDGIWGEHRAQGFSCFADPGAIDGDFDLVLVTVKSFDTERIADEVATRLRAQGFAVSLQNGLGNVETLERRFGPERTLGGRVIFGAEVVKPGHVRVTVYAEPVLLGAWEPGRFPSRDTAARRWAEEFAKSGIPCEYTENLRTAIWAKVFYNAALNPLGALLGVPYGALAESEATRGFMDHVIDEAYAVARAEGIPLPWPDAGAYRELFYSRLVPSTYDHRSSMLQDLERGRRTEIEAINGAVWRLAERHGMAAPYNEALTRLVRYREGRR